MSFTSWFRGLKVPSRQPRRHTSHRLRLEVLEDRVVPTVTSLADSGIGSLRAAVLAANLNPGHDDIYFAKGLVGTIVLTTGQLNITDGVTIHGPGASKITVSGNGASRVFAIDAGVTVQIEGLTIADGRADEGGGVLNAGRLTVMDCIFADNKAVADSSTSGLGGGLFNESGGVLGVSHSTFRNNQVIGGAMGLGFGGGLMNEGTAFIVGSTFMRNKAVGGATAHGAGGGIANMNDATLIVSSSTFTGNLATDGLSVEAFGGGIDNENGSSLSVGYCTFKANEAQTLTHTLSDTSLSSGGAIDSDGGLKVFHSRFISNLSDSYHGGTAGAIYTVDSHGQIADCTFTNNIAKGYGPGGDANGGALFTQGFVTITGSTFTGNEAIGTAGADGVNTSGAASGGAIHNEFFTPVSTTLIVANCQFTYNRALGGGGIVSGILPEGPYDGGGFGGAIDDDDQANLIILNSTLTGNLAQGGSGAPSPTGGTAPGAVGEGGAIDIELQSTARVIDCTIRGNMARGGAGVGGARGGDGIGGGIAVGDYPDDVGSINTCSLTLMGGSLVGNVAAGGAGGTGAHGGYGLGGAIEVGLFGSSSLSTADVTGTLLLGNAAIGGTGGVGGSGGDGLGGGICAASGTTSLEDMQITRNHAARGAKGMGLGGTPGEGVGGGIDILGPATAGADGTAITGNFADTFGNDVFGMLLMFP
jgi:hypothetical protein